MFKGLLTALCIFWPIVAFSQDIATINFDFDSDQLDAKAQEQIAQAADTLKNTVSYKPTVVVGYTDAVGASGYNNALGLRRARAVAAALAAEGVAVDRLSSVTSRGEADLVVNVRGPERQNRRVTVSLSDMLGACRTYRDISISQSTIGPTLQQDLVERLAEASSFFDQLARDRQTGAAFQMAGAAREDCKIAVEFDPEAVRKAEYSQKCVCNSERMRVALR